MSSEKSSYTLDFVLWLIEQISFHEVVAAYFPSRAELQDVLLPQLFPECPWVWTKGDWTFWTQDMIWLAYVFYEWHIGRFPFGKKNPEISMGAKVEFPIGKKLFHLVVNPGTSRCPTVDLELVQTTRNVNGTRHSVRKFQPGKRDHLFRFSTFSGNFPVGWTDETCSIYRWTGNSGNLTKWKAPIVSFLNKFK